jgi:hypothetical protein
MTNQSTSIRDHHRRRVLGVVPMTGVTYAIVINRFVALIGVRNRNTEGQMMAYYFAADKTISFSKLTDGRLDKYGVDTFIDDDGARKPSSATLMAGCSKVLVRSNPKGEVTKLIPVDVECDEISTIVEAIAYAFDTEISLEHGG